MHRLAIINQPFLAMSLALTWQLEAQDPAVGKASYEINCLACHQLDAQTVGPSMIRVAAAYPEGKLPEFLEWTKNPKKKDPLAIQMPTMNHIPDNVLASIHAYILKAVVGKKEKKGSPQFVQYKEPKRKLPYVSYSFLPNTSPASLAIILPNNTSLCWDTEKCRIRYAWESSRTNNSAWRKEATLESDPFYRESSNGILESLADKPLKYRGYRLIKGYPEFRYEIDGMEIRELIGVGGSDVGFTRTFNIRNAKSLTKFDFTHEGGVILSTDQGVIESGILKLEPAQATRFTVTVSKK